MGGSLFMFISKIRMRIRGLIFCLKTKNNLKTKPRILGKYTIRGSPTIKIGKNITIYPHVIFLG
jgi:hypothetical protein